MMLFTMFWEHFHNRDYYKAWWCTLIILVIQKADSGESQVQGLIPLQKKLQTILSNLVRPYIK